MVTTYRVNVKEGNTWHLNGPFAVDLLYKAKQSGPKNFDLHNASVKEIQKVIAECITEGKRFRARGSLWSLNDIAFNDGRIHDNTDLDMRFDLDPTQLEPNASVQADHLVFSQCGATVRQLSSFLEDRNKSLKVSGGSNGQTIAGAISTGVHGGAFDRQCISDYVKGLQLVTGPGDEDRVYLERASDPVLNQQFVTTIDSRLVRDDELFNAAIVGLGSFGFIAGVVLEVEDIYSLKRYVREIQYDDAIRLFQSLDFENSPFRIGEEVDANGKPVRPYHFKAYINQYTRKSVAEVIYRIPYQKTQFPEFEVEKELHPDLFRVMRWAMEKSNGKITKLLTSIMQGSAMPNPKKETAPVIGTLGDIFHSVGFSERGFSWALGVDQANLAQAMDVFMKVVSSHNASGLTAIKLVRQTKATIGFTKFPVTAVIHMDGIQWNTNENPWSQQYIEQEVVKAFVRDGIEFTLHWGKNGAWGYPGLIDLMYGNQDDKWMEQRSKLLSYEMAALFSNDFIKRIGLAGYNRNAV